MDSIERAIAKRNGGPHPRRPRVPKKESEPKAKSSGAAWKSLPDKELAAHLLEHQTLADNSWAPMRGAQRQPKESRTDFIERVLLLGK